MADWYPVVDFENIVDNQPRLTDGPIRYVNTDNVKKQAFVYNTYKRGDDSAPLPDSIQFNPDVLVYVLPFSVKNTFNHADVQNKEGNVSNVSNSEALKVPDRPIPISGIIKANVTTSKRSHVSNMNAEIVDSNNALMYELAPGDWIFCHMFADKSDANRVRKALFEVAPINGFYDGLKFIGRVQTVRRVGNFNPMTGQGSRRIVLNAVGFNEFDAAVYFDPALLTGGEKDQFATRFFGGDMRNLLDKIATPSGAIPALVGTLLGTGPGDNAKRVTSTDGLGNDSEQMIVSPNTAFNIPPIIGRLLGITSSDENRPTLGYADILACIFGTQTYAIRETDNDYCSIKADFKQNGFVPILKPETTGSMRYETPDKLQGAFSAQIIPWDNTPVWEVLRSFLVDTINEMYTCLRVDGYGRVLPHLIARQIPFNTDIIDTSVKLTRFTNLPRWKIEPAQVTSYDVTKSNSLRANYVQVRNTASIGFNMQTEWSRARNRPRYDVADIQRNGLFPLILTTNTLITNLEEEKLWTSIAADRSMGGHLKYCGSISTLGIQEPICEGDNLQYDDIIFHIEGVQHSFSVNSEASGFDFRTTLILTNGVPSNGKPFPDVYERLGRAAGQDVPVTTLE